MNRLDFTALRHQANHNFPGIVQKFQSTKTEIFAIRTRGTLKMFYIHGCKGYFYCLFPDMHEGLVGWVSIQAPRFPFRKSICTTDRCVVQFFSQHLFGEKQRREKQGLRRALLPSQGRRQRMDFRVS